MSELPDVRFLLLPVHMLPSALKASRAVFWEEGCFRSVKPLLHFDSSLFLCFITLQHRMSLKSQRVYTIPAKAFLHAL